MKEFQELLYMKRTFINHVNASQCKPERKGTTADHRQPSTWETALNQTESPPPKPRNGAKAASHKLPPNIT